MSNLVQLLSQALPEAIGGLIVAGVLALLGLLYRRWRRRKGEESAPGEDDAARPGQIHVGDVSGQMAIRQDTPQTQDVTFDQRDQQVDAQYNVAGDFFQAAPRLQSADKRAEVIDELNHLLVQAERSFSRLTSLVRAQEVQTVTEILEAAQNSRRAFYEHFDENRVYLDEDLCDKLDRFNQVLEGAWNDFYLSQVYDHTKDHEAASYMNRGFGIVTEIIPKLRREIERDFRKYRDLAVPEAQVPEYELKVKEVTSKVCHQGVHIDYEFSIESLDPWPSTLIGIGISDRKNRLKGLGDWQLGHQYCRTNRQRCSSPLKLPYEIPYPSCDLKVTIHAQIGGLVEITQKEMWNDTMIPLFLLIEYDTPPWGYDRKKLAMEIQIDLGQVFKSILASQETKDT